MSYNPARGHVGILRWPEDLGRVKEGKTEASTDVRALTAIVRGSELTEEMYYMTWNFERGVTYHLWGEIWESVARINLGLLAQ